MQFQFRFQFIYKTSSPEGRTSFKKMKTKTIRKEKKTHDSTSKLINQCVIINSYQDHNEMFVRTKI